MTRSLLSSLVLVLLAVGAAGAEPAAAPTAVPMAEEVVREATESIASQINGHEKEYAANKKQLYALVDRDLLPKFDVDYAGKLVLGKAWRDATPAQREKFVNAFYNFLLRSYSTAVLKFRQDAFKILPPRNEPKDGKTVVQAEYRLNDGSMTPVSYSMRLTSAGWKAYDVRIEGISYVQTYRNQFNAEVAAKGLDALIARLEKETAEIDAGKREPDRLSAPSPNEDGAT